jgi:hypothetical protein
MKHQISKESFFNYEILVNAYLEFISLLENEIQLLKVNKGKEIEKTYNKKVDLLNYFISQKQLIAETPAIKDSLTQEQKSNLLNLAQKLQETIDANSKEIAKASLFNQEIIRLVAHVVSDRKEKVVKYNDLGKKTEKNATNDAPWIKINAKI